MTDLRQCETHRIGYWHPSGCPMCKTDANQGAIARALLDARAELFQARADAQAAVALVVERAANEIDCGCQDGVCRFSHACPKSDVDTIRALADADGLAAVEALRAERDHWETLAIARDANRRKAEAERDRLAADLTAAKQRETGLVGALPDLVEIYRLIKLNKVRRHGEIAKVIADHIAAVCAAFAEVQARDDAPTWHERRTMLPDGDARKEGGK